MGKKIKNIVLRSSWFQFFVGPLHSMGIPDTSLLDLIVKVRSWLYRESSNLQWLSGEFEMPENGSKMCCECHTHLSNLSHRHQCQSCGRWFCGKCIPGYESRDIESNGTIKHCKVCSEMGLRGELGRKYSEKVHPSASPRESPEPPSPCFNSERIKCSADTESIQSDQFSRYLEARDYGYSPHAVTSGGMTPFIAHPSPVCVRRTSSR